MVGESFQKNVYDFSYHTGWISKKKKILLNGKTVLDHIKHFLNNYPASTIYNLHIIEYIVLDLKTHY